jgi:acyl-CoA thioester hydrolase
MASLHGLMFMVRRVKVDYLAPARLDDSLLVVTETRSIRAASAHLRQSFMRDGRVLVVLEIELVCVRLADARPARIPPRWRQALEQTCLEAAPPGA